MLTNEPGDVVLTDDPEHVAIVMPDHSLMFVADDSEWLGRTREQRILDACREHIDFLTLEAAYLCQRGEAPSDDHARIPQLKAWFATVAQ